MTSYAVAHLREVSLGEEIVAYVSRIDATLVPFGGRFLVHGDKAEVLEGAWPGDLIVIAFPDRASAEAWYASPAYQEILPLRLRNSQGDVVLVDGVGPEHRATDILAG
ncbi:MAG: DUF1330 domain-containing protein [Rhodovibrionaceae bacterium]